MRIKTEQRSDAIIFRPIERPLEAPVVPAEEKRRCGVLSMAPHAWEAICRWENQRAKIWVR